MKKMEILVEEKTENQVKKRKFVKVKKRKKRKKAETITPAVSLGSVYMFKITYQLFPLLGWFLS